MSVSRRQFLQRGGILAAGAVLPLKLFGASVDQPAKGPITTGTKGQPSVPLSLPQWNQQFFRNSVGSEFSVQQSAKNKVWLKLLSVAEPPAVAHSNNSASMSVHPPKPPSAAPQTENYLLQFYGTTAKPLTQGTYLFEHEKIGQFYLFIVPDSNQTYTAVINRLL